MPEASRQGRSSLAFAFVLAPALALSLCAVKQFDQENLGVYAEALSWQGSSARGRRRAHAPDPQSPERKREGKGNGKGRGKGKMRVKPHPQRSLGAKDVFERDRRQPPVEPGRSSVSLPSPVPAAQAR